MSKAHEGLPKVKLPGESTLYNPDELPVAYDSGSFVNILQDMFGSRRERTELEMQPPRQKTGITKRQRERMRQRLQELEDSRN